MNAPRVATRLLRSPVVRYNVSVSSLSKNFNEVLCDDHLYLEEILLVHCMDLIRQYSSAFVDNSTDFREAVIAPEACWVS